MSYQIGWIITMRIARDQRKAIIEQIDKQFEIKKREIVVQRLESVSGLIQFFRRARVHGEFLGQKVTISDYVKIIDTCTAYGSNALVLIAGRLERQAYVNWQYDNSHGVGKSWSNEAERLQLLENDSTEEALLLLLQCQVKLETTEVISNPKDILYVSINDIDNNLEYRDTIFKKINEIVTTLDLNNGFRI